MDDPRAWPACRQLVLTSPGPHAAALGDALRALGALGVLAQALDASRVVLTVVFDDAVDADVVLDAVRAEVAALRTRGVDVGGRMRLRPVTGGDWAEAFPDAVVPVAVGRRLLVVPPWIAPRATDRLALVIDARGFGTGHHPTTAGCLAALEALVLRTPPAHALDLGTGSGILAVAAARLGVARVVAVDAGRDAVVCARENAARNGVGARVECVHGDATTLALGPAPLVLANLLAPVHAVLASRYPALVAPGGTLILGGLTAGEAPALGTLLAAAGFALEAATPLDGWTTLVLARR